MNRLTFSLGLMVLTLALISCSAQTQEPTAPQDFTAEARSFIDLLVKEDYAAAEKNFDTEMKNGLPQDKLEAAWKGVVSQYGPFKKQDAVQRGKAERYDIVVIKCEFEKGRLGIRLAFNKKAQISGLFFDPAQ